MEYRFKEYHEKPVKRGHLNMGGENPAHERIDVTSKYFERNGRPVIDVMGEYHFSRDNKENWYRELCKMRAGGVTVVATYLLWLYHEETEGEFDFSGDLDIRRFVKDAERAGLMVFLRIGPFAHGECRNGGFPDWLLKKDYRLRDNNEQYLEKARIWYEHIYEEVKGLLYRDGGPIIGIQLENELTDYAEHLLALKKLAVGIGFDVPLYTVTGWNSLYGAKIPVSETVPVFAAYADAPWDESPEKLPPSWHYVFSEVRNDSAVGKDILSAGKAEDGWALPYEDYPYATCEIGAGLQFTHHRRPVISGMDAYALSLVKLGCGNNLIGYYMYHGGTNRIGKYSTFQESKATGYPNDYTILNYDFHTALTQYGRAREQYGLLNLLHLFVADFGEQLAKMDYVPSVWEVLPEDTKTLRYGMRTDGESGYVFVNNYARLLEMDRKTKVEIDTGMVRFPAIDVQSGLSFFLPFWMKLNDSVTLKYATVQPLCRVKDTFFFMEIPGIPPRFCLQDGRVYEARDIKEKGVRLVTVPMEQAVYMRKLSGELYLGDGVNVYEAGGRILAIEDGTFTYQIWKEDHFDTVEVKRSFRQAVLTAVDCEEPFVPPYREELQLGGARRITWQKLNVDSDEGMVCIKYRGDAAQIYADGKLVADEYYCGEPWSVPAALIYGHESYLVYSELWEDCYLEE